MSASRGGINLQLEDINDTDYQMAKLLILLDNLGQINLEDVINLIQVREIIVPYTINCKNKPKGLKRFFLSYDKLVEALGKQCVILEGCGVERARKLTELAKKKYNEDYGYSLIEGTKNTYMVCKASTIEFIKALTESPDEL